jgi:hypothetical protein
VFGLLVGLALPGSRVGAETLDFEQDRPGEAPARFAIAKTGAGEAPRWVVEEDASAPSGGHVLVQRSTDDTASRFPLVVYEPASLLDGVISTRFKTIAGAVDQAAGIVWRLRDPENYYLVRANALEGNVVLYKVERGKRTDLDPVGAGPFAYGRTAPIRANVWHVLRVEVIGDRFRVFLDGTPLFDVRDTTFAEAGRAGLWTKADSVTAFDDLTIVPAAPSP